MTSKYRILITGSAGFIGFHTAMACSLQGHEVEGLDNFCAYYSQDLKQARAKKLEEIGVKTHVLDITDKKSLNDLVVRFKPSHIIHLAAQAGVRYSLTHPEEYIKSNIDGFLSVLETCRTHRTVKLLYASSSSVYGRNEKIPFHEEDRCDRQANLYGVTKKSNELMAECYHNLFKIPVAGFRFFTVYGPWGRPDMAYYSFTDKAFKGLPIKVFNNGQMQRDFTYIDDIVDGLINALELPFGNFLFNLGNRRPESLLKLIDLIEKETSKSLQKEYLPMQQGEIVSTCADISLAEELLSFSPKTTLKHGIEKFVSWYREFHQPKE